MQVGWHANGLHQAGRANGGIRMRHMSKKLLGTTVCLLIAGSSAVTQVASAGVVINS